VDDGGADGLEGREVPALRLRSTRGELDLAALAGGLLVCYVYPRTGRPGVAPPPGWDETPGARGCTPQSCAFRDEAAAFAELGASLVGLSAQPLSEQLEFAEREHVPYPVASDPGLALAEALDLPTFEIAGMRLYRRLTFVARAGRVERVFYPVFPPDRNAADVLAWLRQAASSSCARPA
jgi:peroxiredoxin